MISCLLFLSQWPANLNKRDETGLFLARVNFTSCYLYGAGPSLDVDIFVLTASNSCRGKWRYYCLPKRFRENGKNVLFIRNSIATVQEMEKNIMSITENKWRKINSANWNYITAKEVFRILLNEIIFRSPSEGSTLPKVACLILIAAKQWQKICSTSKSSSSKRSRHSVASESSILLPHFHEWVSRYPE